MSSREPLVVWRDIPSWVGDGDSFAVDPRGAARLSTGYYLLLPVGSEKEGWELAKRIKSQSDSTGDQR